jgi:hypothetical protein
MDNSIITLETAVSQRVRSIPPWTGDEFVRLMVTNALGLVLIAAGAIEATGSGSAKTNLAWLNLSLAGLIVSGVGNGLWLFRGRQAVTSARVMALSLFMAEPTDIAYEHAGETSPLVSGSEMTRYHRAQCALANGRSLHVASRTAHEADGLLPCEVCNP